MVQTTSPLLSLRTHQEQIGLVQSSFSPSAPLTLGLNSSLLWAVLYTVGGLAASLLSPHQTPVAAYLPPGCDNQNCLQTVPNVPQEVRRGRQIHWGRVKDGET